MDPLNFIKTNYNNRHHLPSVWDSAVSHPHWRGNITLGSRDYENYRLKYVVSYFNKHQRVLNPKIFGGGGNCIRDSILVSLDTKSTYIHRRIKYRKVDIYYLTICKSRSFISMRQKTHRYKDTFFKRIIRIRVV